MQNIELRIKVSNVYRELTNENNYYHRNLSTPRKDKGFRWSNDNNYLASESAKKIIARQFKQFKKLTKKLFELEGINKADKEIKEAVKFLTGLFTEEFNTSKNATAQFANKQLSIYENVEALAKYVGGYSKFFECWKPR